MKLYIQQSTLPKYTIFFVRRKKIRVYESCNATKQDLICQAPPHKNLQGKGKHVHVYTRVYTAYSKHVQQTIYLVVLCSFTDKDSSGCYLLWVRMELRLMEMLGTNAAAHPFLLFPEWMTITGVGSILFFTKWKGTIHMDSKKWMMGCHMIWY